MQTTRTPSPAHATPGWRGLGSIVAEVLLILIVIGLLVATWMPAIVGTSVPGDRQIERAQPNR